MFLKGVSAMSSPYPILVTATQVGTYFVGQYYQVLQHQPHLVHQFYSASSTLVRLDGNNRDTVTGLLQIHALVMSLNITGIEIKTACSLESWNGGVLVMVSGAVRVKDFNSRRKFVQTFFLAPQDKGYFVLNDVFHYIEEEQIHQHPAVLLAQHNLDLKLNAFVTNPEPVPSYMLGGDIRGQELLASVNAKENGLIDKYSFPEQQLRQAVESESIVENSCGHESNGSLLHTVNTVLEHMPPPVEEPVVEPPKQTYASIVAKGQPAPSVVSQVSVNMKTPPASDSDHDTNHTAQQPVISSNAVEVPSTDIVDEISPAEYEGEIKSVYVRNLPTTVSKSEIMEEFKKFGEISPDGVVIRIRKDVGICYAFVEFEDMASVHNAVKAGSAVVAGQQVYIEERRPNSYIPSRGGRRGRGRGGYPMEASRGRFSSRSYGRGSSYDGNNQDYTRSRGNGFYRPTPRQDRALSGNQVSRNGQTS
ncbi:nuclear transport factor 2-like [Hibiscus syriacus]|uniref:nuclear transport factor 2-like n=1 Tax=Hibiscus syriacus TaxID=106335 RepID=UPI001921D3F9|nr:nuclear transport factor 2-like [Hibiscus syriacus]